MPLLRALRRFTLCANTPTRGGNVGVSKGVVQCHFNPVRKSRNLTWLVPTFFVATESNLIAQRTLAQNTKKKKKNTKEKKSKWSSQDMSFHIRFYLKSIKTKLANTSIELRWYTEKVWERERAIVKKVKIVGQLSMEVLVINC